MYAHRPAITHSDGIEANSKNQDLTPMRYGMMKASRYMTQFITRR
jgi:hypothetical protein